MKKNHFVSQVNSILFIFSIVLSSCVKSLQSNEYIFFSPSGFETMHYIETSSIEHRDDIERIIFSKGKENTFWVTRKNKPSGSDLKKASNYIVTK